MSDLFPDLNVPSPEEAQRWRNTAKTLVDGVPPIISLSMLQARNWPCIAMEDELEREPASTLAYACAKFNFTSCWSIEIPWTQSERVPSAYHSNLSASSLCALSKEVYLGSCFLIVEEAGRFVLSSDGDLYWMLAGPRMFLEAFGDTRIEDRLEMFGRNVESYLKADPRVLQSLSSVHKTSLLACASNELAQH